MTQLVSLCRSALRPTACQTLRLIHTLPAGVRKRRGKTMTNVSARSKSQTAAPSERPVPVYQMLAEDIKALGIDAVFGLMSDDTAIFATALDTIGVRL